MISVLMNSAKRPCHTRTKLVCTFMTLAPSVPAASDSWTHEFQPNPDAACALFVIRASLGHSRRRLDLPARAEEHHPNGINSSQETGTKLGDSDPVASSNDLDSFRFPAISVSACSATTRTGRRCSVAAQPCLSFSPPSLTGACASTVLDWMPVLISFSTKGSLCRAG